MDSRIEELRREADYLCFFEIYKQIVSECKMSEDPSKALKAFYEKSSQLDEVQALLVQYELLWEIQEPEYIEKFLEKCIHDTMLSAINKRYIGKQIDAKIFTNPALVNDRIRYWLNRAYSDCFLSFYNTYKDKVDYLYSEERNSNLVFVTINQFLGMSHGPTKTVLDRCYELIKNQKKQVILINTAEFISNSGKIAFYSQFAASYFQEWSEQETINYLGVDIPFMQFEDNTPNSEAVEAMLNFVTKYKPEFILNIGGESVLTDVCSLVVPVLTIATVPSDVSTTRGQFQVIGHRLTETEEEFLQKVQVSKKSVIEGGFTWSLREQDVALTREQLGIPQNKKVALVVGARLTYEVSDEFLEMLLACAEDGLFIAFAGVMSNYEEKCAKYKMLADNSVFLGFQSDMLAVCECADLYINPYRLGGGTSVIEAMYKGLPAISLDYGDVALGAGQEFLVNNFEEMKQEIKHYLADEDYYDYKSAMARERANQMLDTHAAFSHILNEFYKRVDLYEEERRNA